MDFPRYYCMAIKKKQREKPRSPGPHPRAPPMKAGSLFKCLVDSIYPELLFQLGIWLDATSKHRSTIFSVNKTEVPVQLTCSLNLAVMVQVMPSNVQVMCSQLLPPTWKVFNTTSQLLHIEHIWRLLPFTLCMNAPFWIVGGWRQTPFGLSVNPGDPIWPPTWKVWSVLIRVQ